MTWEGLFKVFTVGGGAIIGYLFGGWTLLLQILLIFIVVDWLSGLIASWFEGKLSSKTGFKGIAKKVMILLIVTIAYQIDQVLGADQMIMNATIFFYLGNELLSIIENAGRTGLNIPQPVKNAVLVLQGKGEGK